MPATVAREPRPSAIQRFNDWLNHWGPSSHIMRAMDRYFNRLGPQFAGGLTFFTVLSMVPMLMFMFSGLGWALTVFRPDLLATVMNFIDQNINVGDIQEEIVALIRQYLFGWRGVGLFALITAIFTGAMWMQSLKQGVRAMSRPDFDIRRRYAFPPMEMILNTLLFVVVMILLLVSLAVNQVGTWLATRIVRWLTERGLDFGENLLRFLTLTVSLLVAFLLFYLIYSVLPEERTPRVARFRGSVMAAVAFSVLQGAAGLLGRIFASNRATQIFGPIIVVMLFLNFFAQLIIIIASWVGTWNQPAVARRYHPADEVLRDRSDTIAVVHHWEYAERDLAQRRQQAAARLNAQKRFGRWTQSRRRTDEGQHAAKDLEEDAD